MESYFSEQNTTTYNIHIIAENYLEIRNYERNNIERQIYKLKNALPLGVNILRGSGVSISSYAKFYEFE